VYLANKARADSDPEKVVASFICAAMFLVALLILGCV
jgi:hypothetical protein